MESNNFFVKNKSILTFLILEVVALTAFNFGNISHIFGIAGGVLAILGIFAVLGIEKDKKSLIPFLIPVGLLLVVSLLGSLNAFSKGFTVTSNIGLALSLPGFFILGFVLRKFEDVKTKTVLFVVGGAIAAVTLFGLFSTIVEYGFFYRLIYKNTPNYYFDGAPYNVTKEMYWLVGFGFTEVFIEYGSLFAILSASFLPGLLFLSPKRERNEFIICALFGGIGLATLLVLPNFKAIAIFAIVSAFAFIYKFLWKNEKAKKIIGISFISLLGLAVLFFIIAIINVGVGYKFTGILNRLFVQNRFMLKVTPVIEALFKKGNFFGIAPLAIYDEVIKLESNMFEVQLLKEVGLIGTILFGLFLVSMGYFILQYLKKSKDSDYLKNIFIVMVLVFFVYESLFNIVLLEPHTETYDAFLRNPTLLVMLFVLGFIFVAPDKKEEKENE